MRFALNHMTTPARSLDDFVALARKLGISDLELRNDLEGVAIADGTPPEAVRAATEDMTILSINALYPFNDWSPEVEAKAVALADYAQAAGVKGLVLVPRNDGTVVPREKLLAALRALKEILGSRGLVGLVEPLGFEFCSLRFKRDAVAAIREVGGEGVFRLVHDTFHHYLAAETEMFPELTGLVHISGVTDRTVASADIRDAHRVLVDGADIMDNAGQIRALRDAGCDAPLSFEPFAAEVHALADPEKALAESIAYLEAEVAARQPA
jgi:2-keto-myo-inositol isomerase